MRCKRKRETDLQKKDDSVFGSLDFNVIYASPVDRMLPPNQTKKKVVHKHACEYTNCDKTYSKKCELQYHQNFKHLKIYNNICDRVDDNGIKCDFKCEEASTLKKHKNGKHDKIKEHKCSDCESFFINADKSRKHWNRWHSNSDDPCRTKYKCVCFLGFPTRWERDQHWTIHCSPLDHPSRFQFKCTECELGFPARRNRDDHWLRQHSAVNDDRRIAFNERRNANFKSRYANDPNFRIKRMARRGIRRAFDNSGFVKLEVSEKLTGCSSEELIVHLDNNDRGYVFGDDVTFGKLANDHVKPMDAFDLYCYIELLKACNWRNIQLLTEKENANKSNSFTPDEEAAYNASWRGIEIEKEAVKWRTENRCVCAKCVG